jgi:beta-glucosidase
VPKQEITVLQGIRELVGSRAKVLYAEGCAITVGGSWGEDVVTPSDPRDDARKIDEAVAVARQADVVILAIGGNEQTSREAWSRTHMGDRTSLDLIGAQNDLARALVATGKPVVALLFNGRPLAATTIAEHVPAVLECWYLGQECGTAVAEVLFGDRNPGGKLPITVPRSVGHVPAYYNHKPSARRGYLFDDVTPLYPFGFGLSYTAFALSAPQLRDSVIRVGDSTKLMVQVRNTGKRSGSEVVQMYIRDRVSSVTRPVKELKGFRKVWLQPGGAETVELDITPRSLEFHDADMRCVVEPGEFDIMVGTSSRDADLQIVQLRVEP